MSDPVPVSASAPRVDLLVRPVSGERWVLERATPDELRAIAAALERWA